MTSGTPILSGKIVLALLAAAFPSLAPAAWQSVAVEQGKRVEIDPASIAPLPSGGMTAKGRIVLDRPIIDPKTSASYRIIEIESRYDCAERTHATLKRTYFKEEGQMLRQEEVRSPFEMPVRSGTPDDRLLRSVCRPKGASASTEVGKTLDKVNELAGDLRKANDALVEQAVKKDTRKLALQSSGTATPEKAPVSPESKPVRTARTRAPTATPPRPVSQEWSYEGNTGPEHWGRLRPEYATCANGHRQSPIDLSNGFAVDLEPIQFFYQPGAFRVADKTRHLQLYVFGGGIMLLGKQYHLTHVQFHAPSEFTIEGKASDMEAQLVHRADDGKLAIVSIRLEKGTENPVIQAALNNLPLEKEGEVAPPGQTIDLSQLLPANKDYFTFMGSLTAPPCSEDVMWMVIKQTQQISPAQLSIFQRLYRPNARPVQPTFGRIIKESR